MPYVGSRNAVIAVLGIADLLVTSLGAQGSVKLTGQADGSIGLPKNSSPQIVGTDKCLDNGTLNRIARLTRTSEWG
jgi:hypothetical protein